MPAETTTLQEFESVYPKLQAAILEHAKSYKLPQGEMDWFKLVCGQLNHNIRREDLKHTDMRIEPRNQPSWRQV